MLKESWDLNDLNKVRLDNQEAKVESIIMESQKDPKEEDLKVTNRPLHQAKQSQLDQLLNQPDQWQIPQLQPQPHRQNQHQLQLQFQLLHQPQQQFQKDSSHQALIHQSQRNRLEISLQDLILQSLKINDHFLQVLICLK